MSGDTREATDRATEHLVWWQGTVRAEISANSDGDLDAIET
ncbi:hypothetical protein V6582_00300 (plasmid) [Agrobacterium vitis]|nr:hypothetical protein [Agrobacterium vitis]